MTTITTNPMTREEVKRYLFAGDAHITVYNNISKHIMNFDIYYSNMSKEYVVSSPIFASKDRYFIGIVKSNCLWRLEPWTLSPSIIGPYHVDWIVFSWLIRMLFGIEKRRDDVEISVNSNRCACCGKLLTDHKSLRRGLGPHCWKEAIAKEKKEAESENRMNESAKRFYWEILFPSRD
jgi:hypothetical protein